MSARHLAPGVVLWLAVAGAGHASVLHDHVTYWLEGGSTLYDPDQSEIDAHLDELLVKIEQIVYDKAQSTAILAGVPGDHGDHLWSYSVTNLGLDERINEFTVPWPASGAGVLVTVNADPNSSGLLGWTPSQQGSDPVWQRASGGIRKSSTMGGFWATCDSPDITWETGTTGTSIEAIACQGSAIAPVPEPMTLAFLGFGALLFVSRSRRAVRIAALALACGGISVAAHAAILSEDVTEWTEGSTVVLKVQQTVYDETQTQAIMADAGLTAPDGSFLYAYTLWNLELDDAITSLKVDWPAGVLVAVHADPDAAGGIGFTASNDSGDPLWQTAGAGIGSGAGFGGFWAISNESQDQLVPATVVAGDPIVNAEGTTGPIPEPSTLLLVIGAWLVIGLTGGRR